MTSTQRTPLRAYGTIPNLSSRKPLQYTSVSKKMPRKPPPKSQSKLQPTHFLCLPLLTSSSTPQLASALHYFKSTLPGFPPTPDASATVEARRIEPLIPDGALRPLGTLHLTLGVMSLPSGEKLTDALKLLQSLDLLAFLRQAEETVSKTAPASGNAGAEGSQESQTSRPARELDRNIHDPRGSFISPILEPSKSSKSTDAVGVASPSAKVARLSFDLLGLHTFPSASKATVLHLSPVDRTNRLFPFCVLLRNLFVDADIMTPDSRPLVLHATIVNTVYVNKKRRGEGRKRSMGKISFDATELMSVFNERKGVKSKVMDQASPQESEPTRQEGLITGEGPYIWASDVIVDKVKICEMGAKRLTEEEEALREPIYVDVDGVKERMLLGQEYTVVAEKAIMTGDYTEHKVMSRASNRPQEGEVSGQAQQAQSPKEESVSPLPLRREK